MPRSLVKRKRSQMFKGQMLHHTFNAKAVEPEKQYLFNRNDKFSMVQRKRSIKLKVQSAYLKATLWVACPIHNSTRLTLGLLKMSKISSLFYLKTKIWDIEEKNEISRYRFNDRSCESKTTVNTHTIPLIRWKYNSISLIVLVYR